MMTSTLDVNRNVVGGDPEVDEPGFADPESCWSMSACVLMKEKKNPNTRSTGTPLPGM